MDWAYGNQLSVRTIVVGFAVVTVVSTLAVARPKELTLPHISFNIGATAPAANSSSITISSAEAAQAISVVISIDDVHSQQDLVSYADYLMQGDSRISQVQISGRSVSMTYLTTNRVLNVKTISTNTRATVNEDGGVSVAGSWARPLFTHIAQASSPNAGFSDIALVREGSELSPQTEARLLARLHGRFQIGAIQ